LPPKQAFTDLLTEKRFESILVQDVADRAHIKRVTFYVHCQDKYALLDYAVSHTFGQEIEKRTLNACEYTPENFRNLVLAVCEYLSRMHNDCAQPLQHFESLVEGTIKKKLFELLSHWLKQSKSRMPVELPATVTTWAIYGPAVFYSHHKKGSPLETFVDEALTLVAVGLEQFAQPA
jgi:AcrR family transcriptional regulator